MSTLFCSFQIKSGQRLSDDVKYLPAASAGDLNVEGHFRIMKGLAQKTSSLKAPVAVCVLMAAVYARQMEIDPDSLVVWLGQRCADFAAFFA